VESSSASETSRDNETLPIDWARNLSRSYSDLREEYSIRREFSQQMQFDYDDEAYTSEEDPKAVLFRHLFREWLSGDAADGEKRRWTVDGDGYIENGWVRRVPFMRWPCRIDNELTLRDLIRREFRAPSVEERETFESTDGSDGSPMHYPPSSHIDNHVRIQTAFYTLMELNRKLAWAEKLGLRTQPTLTEEDVTTKNRRRLQQAAKGVTCCSTNKSHERTDSKPTTDRKEQWSTTCPLQCGTYLVAHPLMTGYFAKSVIIILDHSSSPSNQNDEKFDDEIGPGGSYGLIINRLALQPVSQEKRLEILRQKLEDKMHEIKSKSGGSETTTHSSSLLDIMKPTSAVGGGLQRPITLTQAIQDLPESVQAAFGTSLLREGGPVNLSLQMIHRKNLDVKCDVTESGDDQHSQASDVATAENAREIGGIQIPALGDATVDTDAIFFGGDVVKASLAVIDGSEDESDFSIIVGASCWSPGQLQSEIDRGCWLPFTGPLNMAMTGMCDHNDIAEQVSGKLSMYPPRPSNSTTMKQSRAHVERPKMDLWLSIMCALGEGEGDLAYAMLDGKKVLDELADTCDNFDR
jgi:hypothetical protein